MKNKILAKSNGITLIEHSREVSRVALLILEASISEDILNNIDSGCDIDNIKRDVEYSALLHDIGKATNHFQDKLNGVKNINKSKFRHNEIGWAFLKKYLNINNKDNILNVVYWHHGISNKQNDECVSSILDTINESDITNMYDILSELIDYEYINKDGSLDEDINYIKSPTYYYDEPNRNKIISFIRSIVISADRLVSEYSNETLDSNKILSIINKNKWSFTKNPYVGSDRYNKQLSIVGETENTTIIKAPAGFGKTLLGLLWNQKSDKKLIWVCPRNFIAKSVYKSITDEMVKFGFNPSIELYLSGEVIESNTKTNGFDSDIIITNIDNYLKPTIDNSCSDRLFLINTCDVVFDEYHELISELPLFSSFINIMKIRHQLTNSRTILLSATPQPCNYLWDTTNNKTKILPDENSHYNAQHISKYKLNVVDDMIVKSNNNELVIFNSLKNIQDYFNENNMNGVLIHSKFEDKKREELFNTVFDLYGINNDKTNNKKNIYSTNILEASLDISLNVLNESIISPFSTLQRIGRINRWGDNTNQSIINICGCMENKGENSLRKIMFDSDLSKNWFNFVKEYDNTDVTLDDLYILYNQFYKENIEGVKKWIGSNYSSSNKKLKEIYPIKFDKPRIKTDVKTHGGNKLRLSEGNGLFITVKKEDGTFTEPFDYKLYGNISDEFGENDNTLKFLNEEINKLKDGRFNYPKTNKYTTLDGYRKLANKSDTPYIVLNKKYSEILGLINN